MKDLIVLTADADARGVIMGVLNRPHSLGIRKITFDVIRHPYRDNGMVTTGTEYIRPYKNSYHYALLIWDHAGSGWENRFTPAESALTINQQLDAITLKDRSASIVIVPELEEWLWHNHTSLARFYQIPLEYIDNCILQFSAALKSEPDKIQRENPKELLQFFLHAIKCTMTPTHFKSIAAQASLRAWRASTSFSLMANILQQWFPPLENKQK